MKNKENYFLYGLLAVVIAVLLASLFFGFQNLGNAEDTLLTQFDTQTAEHFILGSAHIHADFKVYVDGELINFASAYI